MVIRVNSRKEKKALEMIELGFSLLGITLTDFQKMKEAVDENTSLREQIESLKHQLAVAKGEQISDKEAKDTNAESIDDYLSKKESIKYV